MTKYWLNSEPGHNGTKRIADLKYSFTSEKLTFQWQVAFEKFETEIKQQAREFWSLVLPRVYLSVTSFTWVSKCRTAWLCPRIFKHGVTLAVTLCGGSRRRDRGKDSEPFHECQLRWDLKSGSKRSGTSWLAWPGEKGHEPCWKPDAMPWAEHSEASPPETSWRVFISLDTTAGLSVC